MGVNGKQLMVGRKVSRISCSSYTVWLYYQYFYNYICRYLIFRGAKIKIRYFFNEEPNHLIQLYSYKQIDVNYYTMTSYNVFQEISIYALFYLHLLIHYIMIPAFLHKFYHKHNLRPFESTWLIYVHIIGLAAFIYMLVNYHKISSVLPFFIAFWVVYAVGITGGAHRLWAHKSYSASTPLKIFLMLINSGANQGSIYHWSRDHRLHHKFSDTDLDPHSINKGFFFAHVGWLLVKKTPQLVEQGRKIDMSDLMKDPVVMWQKKYYSYISVLMCFILPTITYSLGANIPIMAGFALSMLTYAWVLNVTWCVNSICHMFGSRPWNNKIEPRDNYIVSLLTQGEGYHNWHHEYPCDWRASKDQWYMLNVTARFIQAMAFFKLATVKV